jgi:hypothetical protein
VPAAVVYRRKVGFPLPVQDYLAPLAGKEFFAGGFCLDVLEMHEQGLLEVVSNWRHNVHGFFNILALEIWGRLFFLRQSIDTVTEQLERNSSVTSRRSQVTIAT